MLEFHIGPPCHVPGVTPKTGLSDWLMNFDSSGVSTLLVKPALPSPLLFKQVEAKPETFARSMVQDLLALSPLTFQPPEPNVSMVLFPMIAYCEKLPLID